MHVAEIPIFSDDISLTGTGNINRGLRRLSMYTTLFLKVIQKYLNKSTGGFGAGFYNIYDQVNPSIFLSFNRNSVVPFSAPITDWIRQFDNITWFVPQTRASQNIYMTEVIHIRGYSGTNVNDLYGYREPIPTQLDNANTGNIYSKFMPEQGAALDLRIPTGMFSISSIKVNLLLGVPTLPIVVSDISLNINSFIKPAADRAE